MAKAKNSKFLTGNPEEDLEQAIELRVKNTKLFINRYYEKLVKIIKDMPQGLANNWVDEYNESIMNYKDRIEPEIFSMFINMTDKLKKEGDSDNYDGNYITNFNDYNKSAEPNIDVMQYAAECERYLQMKEYEESLGIHENDE